MRRRCQGQVAIRIARRDMRSGSLLRRSSVARQRALTEQYWDCWKTVAVGTTQAKPLCWVCTCRSMARAVWSEDDRREPAETQLLGQR